MDNTIQSVQLPFHLGCPIWNCPGWSGEVYPASTPKPRWLHWYTRMFNTVEGNSTFYGLPSLDVAQRWADESADGFKFALKVPQAISHEARLIGCDRELDDFVQFASVLYEADRLGPSFLQLPPTFGVDSARQLERFLDRLPGEFPWAVEVRHHDWFDQSGNEQRINGMLRQRGIDKVLFDSRPLFQSEPDDEIESAAQGRKPKTPVRQTVTATRPMLRLVGRNQLDKVEHFIQQWLPIVQNWLDNGLDPYIFTHSPDDEHAPDFARLFWQRYCEHTAQEIPSEYGPDSIPRLPKPPRQMGLF